MFIIKWLKPNNEVYYRYSKFSPMFYTIGSKNQYNHEILDINFIYDNKVWSYEEYIDRAYFEENRIKNKLLDKVVNKLIMLNKH